MAIVYRHIRLDKNEPFYIGIGNNIKRAFDKKNRNIYWNNIINQTEYRVDILFDDLTFDDALIKEQEFIKIYGRKDLGKGTLVNLTDGGEGHLGLIQNKITKNKRSKSMKEKFLDDEYKNKNLQQILSLQEPSIKEKKASSINTDEYKKRRSEISKEIGNRSEIKEKLSKSSKSLWTDEFRKKRSDETRNQWKENREQIIEAQNEGKRNRVRNRPNPHFRKDNNKWRVTFSRFGKKINLGHFSTEQEAQEAIDLWIKNNNYNGTI